MKTRETTWEMPPGFQQQQQPEVQYNPQSQMNFQQTSYYGYGQQQQQASQYGYGQQSQFNQAAKWKKAYDPNSGKDYWYK